MNAEEALAVLSQEARFDLTITVEPQPEIPAPRVRAKRKLKKGKTKRLRSTFSDIVNSVNWDGADVEDSNDSLSGKYIPKYQITATATIFGRECKQIYSHIMPANVEGVKEELTGRFHWHVAQIYASKKVALGSTVKEVKVDLSK